MINMLNKPVKILTFLACVFLSICTPARAQLIAYKAPAGVKLNPDFAVSVREEGKLWQSLPSYPAKVVQVTDGKNRVQTTSFAYFDFSGKVEVSVAYTKGTVKDVKIRPLSYGIVPVVKGNTITFSLTDPRNISIEVNGDLYHNLHLFANPLETSRPSPTDTSVIYYGPGVHYAGTVKVPSNKTVYIAGGAVVQAHFAVRNAENIRIIGRGIVTQMADFEDPVSKTAPILPIVKQQRQYDEIRIEYAKNVEVSGIVILPHRYSIVSGQSKNVTISNIKSFSSEGWGDGIDIFCSTDVLIDRVFMRNSDDCIAIYGTKQGFSGNVDNLRISNSVLWADIAHPILIGTHGNSKNPEILGNMKITNIDILNESENQIDYQGCLSLNAGDSNLIKDISFEDIRVENIRKGQLINMRVMYNAKYNTSAGKGIENIYFKNISYNGSPLGLSIIAGYDETRKIKNITFENLKINGKVIADKMPGKPAWYKTGDFANFFIGEHVENLTFITSEK
ncbi:MAG TPA: glycosyl hydrolase family 28 protein [Pedobacter sp.]|uniref:glycosyl hydrolase family 28 protein n=1 Tax=Pedobacter sp. TaxID=1411316 RepID=UPI002B7A4614|nr:glycosyl hydrolase family 28 protein [Pedobacter sp.]HMI02804.1 glycosyl hydrolase family 28 protein [Pedobacter sp.]